MGKSMEQSADAYTVTFQGLTPLLAISHPTERPTLQTQRNSSNGLTPETKEIIKRHTDILFMKLYFYSFCVYVLLIVHRRYTTIHSVMCAVYCLLIVQLCFLPHLLRIHYAAIKSIFGSNYSISSPRIFFSGGRNVINVNLLQPTCYEMHHHFNIQQLYALPTLHLCVLYLSENKQRLVPLTA